MTIGVYVFSDLWYPGSCLAKWYQIPMQPSFSTFGGVAGFGSKHLIVLAGQASELITRDVWHHGNLGGRSY